MKSILLLSVLLLLQGGHILAAKRFTGNTVVHIPADISDGQRAPSNGFPIEFGDNVRGFLKGTLGIGLPLAIGRYEPALCDPDLPSSYCFKWGDYATLRMTYENACWTVEWTSSMARRLEDCFDIQEEQHWYGGGEVYSQRWPVEGETRRESPFITGDHLNNGSFFAGGVLEKYWLVSNGVGIFVDNDTPLHYSLNDKYEKKVCFTAQDDFPYTVRNPLVLKYHVCEGSDILEAHRRVAENYFKTPTSIPEPQMLIRPFWSTWAQYHQNVDQSIVLNFARRVISEGFELSSHIEIDDKWEACYGQESFDSQKFPDPSSMVEEIKDMNLNVTVWVHPFINFDCPLFKEGNDHGYFVKDIKGLVGFSSWWAGSRTGVIDVTNPAAVEWWHARLRKLQQDTGVDSFKFDAGESNWLPYHSKNTDGNQDLMPNLYTTKFVEACSQFGGLIETRTAHRNQDKGIFIRMMDKDSSWTYGNGLRSMIPTLLHFGLLGYPFVLPDMIGGNAYGGRPSKELYIRWMQANVLMPAVQISIVPWDFDAETVQLTKEVLEIRNHFAEAIIAAAEQATVDGSPMNRPLWWLDPTDRETYTIDSQYTLGNDIIVTPVLDEGAISRDIYLPNGQWTSYPDGRSFTGPRWIMAHPVPMNSIPIFVRA